MFVEDEGVELKVEFINYVGYHYLNVERRKGWWLDNWQNILANKISAISRDATKDYADILFLSLKYSFNWVALFDAAKQKDAWVNEIIVAESLHAFDVQRLTTIRWVDKNIALQQLDNCLHTIAKDILLAADNSLKKSND